MHVLRRRARYRLGSLTAIAGLLFGLVATATTVSTADPAGGQANPYQRGPAPTAQLLDASQGPYAVGHQNASGVTGFRAGTIYYPTTTADGTFGAVAISPGFTGTQSSVSWLGPRLASHGFVVITIDTFNGNDQPDSRGDQLQAALDYLVSSRSGVANRIDRNRLAVMGHSMGGGGALSAARDNPDLQAAIPLAGWYSFPQFSNVRVPSLVIGAQWDTVAPVGFHSEAFYNSLPADLDKAYLELAGADHGAPTGPNTTVARYSVAWLKRFVDDDTRYDQFLCPNPSGPGISEYRSTCPYTDGPGQPTTTTTTPPTPCPWWDWWCWLVPGGRSAR